MVELFQKGADARKEADQACGLGPVGLAIALEEVKGR